MSDPAATIRAAFPNWRNDPYQKAAVDGLLRILFAAESAQDKIDTVGTAIGFTLADLPASLSFGAPAVQAETLAKKLIALASELRKGAAVVRSLTAYADQFADRGEHLHDDLREDHRGTDQIQCASDPPLERNDCPF